MFILQKFISMGILSPLPIIIVLFLIGISNMWSRKFRSGFLLWIISGMLYLFSCEFFADPIITHLLKRCEEDPGMAEDVAQAHKTWSKCFKYIQDQARKRAKGNCAAIRDDVVYEWAEDYFRLDDKALEEKKEKERKEQEAKRKAEAAKKKTGSGKQKKKTDGKKDDREKKTVEPEKKNDRAPKNKEPEGQMSLFDLI